MSDQEEMPEMCHLCEGAPPEFYIKKGKEYLWGGNIWICELCGMLSNHLNSRRTEVTKSDLILVGNLILSKIESATIFKN